MNIVLKGDSINELEKKNIDAQIETDLVEHFYKASPTGAVSAFAASVFLFTLFYLSNKSNLPYLVSWLIGFNIINSLSILLYFYYIKYRTTRETSTWTFLLSFLIISYACFYGACVFFLPEVMSQQFISIIILMIIAAALTTGTVGIHKLAIVAVGLVLMPVTIWFLLKPEIFYRAWGLFVVIYYFFLIGMNRRSTEWLRNSLRAKIETSFFTHQANHDLLTDLPNQRLLLRYLDNFIEHAKQNKTSFIVACFSINRLEMFTNSLGYQAGDLIIQSVAKRFRTLISTEDHQDKSRTNRVLTLPRPDSFTILMGPIQEATMEYEVKKLGTVLESPFHLGRREATLTSSIGVSMYPQDGNNARILLSNAYAAMFQAKQLGGNQIEYYKREINEKTPRMLELEHDLHHALEHKEFQAYYQPIVDLSSGKISGMEALIRWNHPKLGLLLPGDFINVAYETGLIIPMGEWIMQEACNQTARWNNAGFNISLKVSVNLSVKQFHKGDLLEVVDLILKKTKLDPHHLDLELTETEMLDEKIAPLIKELNKRGVSLSIDDFGTGYSGLSYLKFFEIDKIKIDRSFIRDIHNNEESATIVSAILAMAKELKIKTLAEGVETKEELEFLVKRGCNYVQGYYFSKPITKESFTKLLQEGKSYLIS